MYIFRILQNVHPKQKIVCTWKTCRVSKEIPIIDDLYSYLLSVDFSRYSSFTTLPVNLHLFYGKMRALDLRV